MNTSPEQTAIINFMGQVYGDSKKIDEQMVQSSSTLQPSAHVVEKVIRSQLQAPVHTMIPPTPEEIGLTGVGPIGQDPNQQPPQQPMGDPVPPQPDVVIPTPTAVLPPPPLMAKQPSYPQDNSLEISQKLDIIIRELQKLNNAFAQLTQDDTPDSEG